MCSGARAERKVDRAEDAVANQHRKSHGGVEAGLDHRPDRGEVRVAPQVIDDGRLARLDHHAGDGAVGQRPAVPGQHPAGLDAVGGGKIAYGLALGIVKVDGHAVEGKVFAQFLGQRLKEVLPIGAGDHGVVDFKQHLVARLGIPAHVLPL